MAAIEIYWQDLTSQKQEEILEAFGDNCNYDVFPVAIIYTDPDECESCAI